MTFFLGTACVGAIREAILDSQHPDLATSYNNIGLAYARNEQLKKAKIYVVKYEAIAKKKGEVYRNWAMYHALQGDTIKALEFLEKAIDEGYKDLKWITTDSSLESLRKEKKYLELVEKLTKERERK